MPRFELRSNDPNHAMKLHEWGTQVWGVRSQMVMTLVTLLLQVDDKLNFRRFYSPFKIGWNSPSEF
jgi:hypothetical protein